MGIIIREEPGKLDIVSHLEEFRKRTLFSLLAFGILTLSAFINGDILLGLIKKPSTLSAADLVFIAPTEAFVAYLKVCILAAFITSFPVFLYEIWLYIRPALPAETRNRVGGWLVLSLLLFLCGILFSYFVAFPAAFNFLVNFGLSIARPMITLGEYVSFFTAVMFTGGIVFEIPVVMAVATEGGFAEPGFFRKHRQHAILVILVLAAVLTPTQDVVNMIIFAIPMIILFESGIILSSIIHKRKSTKS